jgi:putative membrane protein
MFERDDPRIYDSSYWEHSGNGHAFWWFLMFLLLAVLVGVVAALVFRWLAGRQAAAVPLAPAALGPADDALGLVRMRYARGEIDRDQFLQTSADLGGQPPPAQPPPAQSPAQWPQAEPPPDETPTQQ